MRDIYLAFPIIDDLNTLTKLDNLQKCLNH